MGWGILPQSLEKWVQEEGIARESSEAWEVWVGLTAGATEGRNKEEGRMRPLFICVGFVL